MKTHLIRFMGDRPETECGVIARTIDTTQPNTYRTALGKEFVALPVGSSIDDVTCRACKAWGKAKVRK